MSDSHSQIHRWANRELFLRPRWKDSLRLDNHSGNVHCTWVIEAIYAGREFHTAPPLSSNSVSHLTHPAGCTRNRKYKSKVTLKSKNSWQQKMKIRNEALAINTLSSLKGKAKNTSQIPLCQVFYKLSPLIFIVILWYYY